MFFTFYGRHAWNNLNSATLGSSLLQRGEHDQAEEAPSHREEDTNETSGSVNDIHDLELIRYAEHHALHQESLEQERQTQERLQQEWQEQLERERQEQLERERQERQERERQEQQDCERQEQLERERQEQLERERQEQQERERQEQLERERQEQLEQQERERQEQSERERQEQLERERQGQQDRVEQARMRDAGNRGTQVGLDKLLSASAYNTLVTSGKETKKTLLA